MVNGGNVRTIQPESNASSAEDLDEDLQRALRLSMVEAEKNDNLGRRNDSVDTQQSKQAIENSSAYHYPQVNSETTSNGRQDVQDATQQTAEENHGHIVEQVDHICCELSERMESGLVGKDATEAEFQSKLYVMQSKLQQDCEFVTRMHRKFGEKGWYIVRKSVYYANLIYFFFFSIRYLFMFRLCRTSS